MDDSVNGPPTVRKLRLLICGITSIVGAMSSLPFLRNKQQEVELSGLLRKFFHSLISLSTLMNVKLACLVKNKLRINLERYKQDLCLSHKTEMPKWQQFATETGYSDNSKIIMFTPDQIDTGLTEDDNLRSLSRNWAALSSDIRNFSHQRGWLDSYDELTLRLSLAAETGELAETVQWKRRDTPISELPSDRITSICEEIADLAIYGFHYDRTLHGLRSCGIF